jgi:hypothetical protein
MGMHGDEGDNGIFQKSLSLIVSAPINALCTLPFIVNSAKCNLND